MRNLVVIGILIAALGVFLLARGGVFTTHRNVLTVGDLKITADEQQSVPPWVGGAVMLVGVGVIVAGVRKRA
jgi:hypothetical protein